jgi:putative transferase (TIGR04331 family)
LISIITTDLQETWPEKGQALFLGKWCLTHSHQDRLQKIESHILPNHWDDRGKLKQDFDNLQNLNKKLLQELVPIMNELHKQHFNERFWKLILGNWLNYYTTVIFDRWTQLDRARKLGKDCQTIVGAFGDEIFATSDTADFVQKATSSSQWNHALFSLIAQYIPSIQLIRIDLKVHNDAGTMELSEPDLPAKQLIKNFAGKFANWFKSHDRFFFIDTYIPIKKLALLEVTLGQLPIPRVPISIKKKPGFNPEWRRWAISIDDTNDEFIKIACEVLPMFLPRIYLEGFEDLITQSNALPWPATPNVIFTSNCHFTDDLFKVWAAQKIANGSRLVIGEHGGLGPGLFNGSHEYELSVADKYLSTGWSDDKYENVKPLGYFRRTIKKNTQNPSGKALLVCGVMPRYNFDIRSMMLSSQVLDYLDNLFNFIDDLPQAIQDEILVRLAPQDYGWEQKQRWLDRYPTTRFDTSQSMLEEAGKYRLFIATYMATTYIESLVSNFPTLMYWDPAHWEVKPEAQRYFSELKKVGIFHDCAKSAARHLTNIWNDIPGWWSRGEVQKARKIFCDHYAVILPNTDDLLRQIMLEELNLSTNKAGK